MCYFQILLAEGATVGHASMSEVGGAALGVLTHCVRTHRLGGIASNIGQYLHIELVDPKVWRSEYCKLGSINRGITLICAWQVAKTQSV